MRNSSIAGKGLLIGESIREGCLIAENSGKSFPSHYKEDIWYFYKREGLDYDYLLEIGSILIDATKGGGPACFVNRSCSSNAFFQPFCVASN